MKNPLLITVLIASIAIISTGCKKEEEASTAPKQNEAAQEESKQEKLKQTVNTMKQLGIGFIMFADDNRNRVPKSLDLLIKEGMEYKNFVSPLSKTPAPSSPEEIKNGQTDFVYFYRKYLSSSKINPSETIILTLKPEYAVDGKIPVLYADGHVTVEELPPQLKEATKNAPSASTAKQ